MIERSTNELFDDIESEYNDPDDKAILRARKAEYLDAEVLQQLTDSPGGRLLIKQLKTDITSSLLKLIETRKGRYLSDVESNLTLLRKLINAKSLTKSISSWLDSLNDE